MTPEEAALVQQACAIAAAYLRDDAEGYTILTDDLVPDVSQWADASFLTAIVVGTMLSQLLRTDLNGALRQIELTTADVIPGIGVNWDAAIDIAMARSTGDPALSELSARMDVPTAIQSAFSLAIAGVRQLSDLMGTPPEEMLAILATGAAAEAGT